MYDVPAQIKEVLKDGRIRKEYKFKISEQVDTPAYRTMHTFTSTSLSFTINEYYEDVYLYSSASTKAFDAYVVVYPDGTYVRYESHLGNQETNIRLLVTSVGCTIVIEGLHVSSLTMRALTQIYKVKRTITTIYNSSLVYESVNFDERMCSGNLLKFGLCEGASLEFQYFNHDNYKDCIVDAELDVYQNSSLVNVPEGTSSIRFNVAKSGTFTFTLLTGESANIDIDHGYSTYNYVVTAEEPIMTYACVAGDVINVYDEEHETLQSELSISSDVGVVDYSYSIPMGTFTIAKCSRQASTGIMKATAYNKLKSEYLDNKANLLLQDQFSNSDITVTMFDIMRVLLNEYSIMPSYEQLDPVQISWGGVPWDTNNVTGTITAKFKNEYGINNPINYKEWSALSSSNVKVYLRSSVVTFQTSKKYLFINTLKGSFEELERRAYERVRYIFDAAQLCHPTSGNIYTGDQLMNNLMINDIANGWPGFCSIMVNNNDGLTQDIYYYSTMLWEYEEANNIAHTSCLGTIDDFINRLQDAEFEENEFSEITIFMPQTYGIINASGTTATLSYMIDGRAYSIYPNTYTYYADSSHTSASGTITGIIEGDGAAYQAPMTATNFGKFFAAYQIDDGKLTSTQLVKLKISELPDFTLREIATAVYETQCLFGHLDRVSDLFSGVALSGSGLQPHNGLYPAEELYPGGAVLSVNKSMYSQLWADENNLQSWKYLIITYKGLDGDGKETDYTLQRIVNENGTQNYNMSDNWIMRNLVWSAEDVGTIADAMVEKMRNIQWFPYELWCAGLPYLEVGDMIEIPLGEKTYPSYILQRQLKGINNLQDTYINGQLDIF